MKWYTSGSGLCWWC